MRLGFKLKSQSIVFHLHSVSLAQLDMQSLIRLILYCSLKYYHLFQMAMKLATTALPNIFMFMPESHHLEVNEAKQQKHFRVPVIY